MLRRSKRDEKNLAYNTHKQQHNFGIYVEACNADIQKLHKVSYV